MAGAYPLAALAFASASLLVTASGARSLGWQCDADHRLLMGAAHNGSLWALRLLDSWGQLPVPGLLDGNIALLGNFDECLDAGGKYCLASVQLPALSFEIHRAVAASVDGATAAQRQLLAVASGRPMRWAACVPVSCSAEDAAQLLRTRLEMLRPGGSTNYTSVDVQNRSCSVASRQALAPKEWGFLAVVILVGVGVSLSTLCDFALAEKTGLHKDSAWLSFSARKNWGALTTVNRSGFTSLHGIKFISMGWVLLFHTNSVIKDTPAVNSAETNLLLMYDWTRTPEANGGNLAVNTFFVASGLLLSFTFLRERSRGRRFSLAGFYLHRYLRLTPAYAIVIWLYATVLTRLASGPLWQEVAGAAHQHCAVSWWRNILYINNYQRMQDMCIGQSWYLAVDMQLYWVSPVLLWPIYKWQRAACVIIAAVLLGATSATFAVTYVYNLPWADVYGMTEEEFTQYMLLIYQQTYSRIVPYVIGISLGWILFSTKDKKSKLSCAAASGCWVGSTLLALASVYSLHASYHLPYSNTAAAVFASLRPIAWGLSIAWIIYACEKGHAGPVRALLSWTGFQPLAKLCYGAYLIQYLILFYSQGAARTPIFYGRYYVVHKMLGDTALVLPLAAILYLGFEMPALNLDKTLLNTGGNPKPARSTTAQDNPAFESTERQSAESQFQSAANPANAVCSRIETSVC